MRPPRRTPEELLAARRAKLKAKQTAQASKPTSNLLREAVGDVQGQSFDLAAERVIHSPKKKGNKKK